jgi:hypothetical protein
MDETNHPTDPTHQTHLTERVRRFIVTISTTSKTSRVYQHASGFKSSRFRVQGSVLGAGFKVQRATPNPEP